MVRRLLARILFAVSLSASAQAAAPPPVEAYGKLPGITDVKISPSGQHIAFVATVNNTRRFFITDPTGKPQASGDIGDMKVRRLEWAGDDHLLVISTATIGLGPEFNVQQIELKTVVSISLKTGKMLQVFGKNHELKVMNAVVGEDGTRQIDGHWYGWFATFACHTDKTGCYGYEENADLYRVDLDTGELKVAARGTRNLDDWLISPTGEVLARSYYDQKNGNWAILNGADGDQVLAAGKNPFGGARDLALGRSPDRLIAHVPMDASSPDKEGAYVWREIPLAGGPEQSVPNLYAIDDLIFDPSSNLWIGEVLKTDQQDAVFFSPALQARWQAVQKAFAKYMVHFVSGTTDFNKIMVRLEGADETGSYWLVDVTNHSADVFGNPYPEVKPENVGTVTMVEWKAADGLDLHGVLTLPPDRPAKGLPLVVLPHGGPESRDYPEFDWWAQAFASRGYAVFQPNFRGSSGYGAEFRNAGFGEWGKKMQTDISDGVAALAAKGIVDPKRACIVGGSYGGYAALAGVTVQQGLYRCAVSVSGVADLTDMLHYAYNKSGYAIHASVRYWRRFMGVTSTWERSQLRPITPSELADEADAPILLIHGKSDTVVPYDQSTTMASALRSAGKPYEMVTMDNEDHWLSREATRVQMLTAAVAFVQKHNPADPVTH